MLAPKDRFYADPFLIEKDGKTFIFLEDLRYSEGRAFVSCCELGADGTAWTRLRGASPSIPPFVPVSL